MPTPPPTGTAPKVGGRVKVVAGSCSPRSTRSISSRRLMAAEKARRTSRLSMGGRRVLKP